jgi:hypothetical protein
MRLGVCRCGGEPRVPLAQHRLERPLHAAKLGQPLADLGEAGGRHPTHGLAGDRAAIARAQHARQLVQREPDRERAPHQPQPIQRFGRVQAVPAGAARRRGQHALALVEPDRVDRYAGVSGERRDAQGSHGRRV